MKISKFTFKNEAIWMVVLSAAPVAIALLFLLLVRLVTR